MEKQVKFVEYLVTLLAQGRILAEVMVTVPTCGRYRLIGGTQECAIELALGITGFVFAPEAWVYDISGGGLFHTHERGLVDDRYHFEDLRFQREYDALETSTRFVLV